MLKFVGVWNRNWAFRSLFNWSLVLPFFSVLSNSCSLTFLEVLQFSGGHLLSLIRLALWLPFLRYSSPLQLSIFLPSLLFAFSFFLKLSWVVFSPSLKGNIVYVLPKQRWRRIKFEQDFDHKEIVYKKLFFWLRVRNKVTDVFIIFCAKSGPYMFTWY